jgi:hypothetical protein
MSLRIRRGSDAERLGVRFDQGEIVWVNSTNTSRPPYKLYVGDGVTLGGRDIVETSAGTNLVYNTNTGRLDVSGLTTDDIAAGTNNQFFTSTLAQNAVAELFANGTMTGIEFVYDDLQNKMDVTVTATGVGGSGIESVVEDLLPALGGDLNLNSQNIIGTGNISITGNIVSTGTISATTGLGANLNLNGFNVIGAGDLGITGAITITSTLSAGGGLGSDLSLNGFNLEGLGNIDIEGSLTLTGNVNTSGSVFLNDGDLGVSGTINVNGGLGGDLNLNSYAIDGTGAININGDITSSSVTARVFTDEINTSGSIDGLNVFALAGNDVSFNYYNGTPLSPTSTIVGDAVGNFFIKGYTGTVYQSCVGLIGDWESNANLSLVFPASTLKLVSGNNTNDAPNFATFDANGVFSAPTIQTGVYTTDPSDTRPTGVKGMIIFNDTSETFQGFNGQTWVDLG